VLGARAEGSHKEMSKVSGTMNAYRPGKEKEWKREGNTNAWGRAKSGGVCLQSVESNLDRAENKRKRDR